MSNMSYPIDKMGTISQQINEQLDTALQQHSSILTSRIKGSAADLPDNISSVFLGHINTWDQSIQNAYAGLRMLADAIASGATEMNQQEGQFTQSFQSGNQ